MGAPDDQGNRPRVVNPPGQRPLLVYDGDCGFCRKWVRRWQLRTGDRADYAPYQEAAGRFAAEGRPRYPPPRRLI